LRSFVFTTETILFLLSRRIIILDEKIESLSKEAFEFEDFEVRLAFRKLDPR
jgi:hypothetical protein